MNLSTWETGDYVSVWIKPTERCQLRCKHCFVNQEFLRSSPRWDLATFQRIVARFEHHRDPINGRVGIGSAHGFNKRAGRVVVLVAGAVVDDGVSLDGLFGDVEGDK